MNIKVNIKVNKANIVVGKRKISKTLTPSPYVLFA